jgi:hypothetical protein
MAALCEVGVLPAGDGPLFLVAHLYKGALAHATIMNAKHTICWEIVVAK